MKPLFFKKLIWSIDALESPEHHQKVQVLLKSLIAETGAVVQPVYILGSPFAHSDKPSEFEEAFEALAKKRLNEVQRSANMSLLAEGQILVNRDGSTRAGVQMLIEEAEDQQADAIVLATHGRSGMSRFFMGSFAETLIMRSTVPVITVNPETKISPKVSNILFPTTFQTKYRSGFERVAQLTKSLGARLTVFYKEPHIPAHYMSPLIQAYIEKESIARRQKAEEWKGWAEKFGIDLTLALDNQPGPIVNAIDNVASAGAFDLIALISQSDDLSVPLLGSVARQLVRTAPCPVWVTRLEE